MHPLNPVRTAGLTQSALKTNFLPVIAQPLFRVRPGKVPNMQSLPPSDRALRLHLAALDHAPEDRELFLANACGEDAALLSAVRTLLGADGETASPLASAVAMSPLMESDLDATIAAVPPLMESDLDATIAAAPKKQAIQTKQAEPAKQSLQPKQVEPVKQALQTKQVEPASILTPPPSGGPAPANPDAPVSFVFGKRIAQGGMGAILEADDCKLGRTIAVKIMLDGRDKDEGAKQRFIQEAAVLGKLEHPNIVPIHDLGRDSAGNLYYTMKLVKGRTLQDIINDLRAEKPEALEHYTLDRLLTIFLKVCDALAFAHAQKIIHRDLKPENVMVGEFGEVLVMDWGIAKILDGRSEIGEVDALASPANASVSGSYTATLEGSVMGTPQYMSPEQAQGEIAEMDARSDIFSLGGILYAILTLRPPVEGKDVWEVLDKVSQANITPPTTFGVAATGKGEPGAIGKVLEARKITPLPHIPAGRVPNALSAVAMKALSLEKSQRYQNVATFSADIEKYQGGFATSAEKAGAMKQLLLLAKRHKGVTAALAAMLLLSIGFVIKVMASERAARAAEVVAEEKGEAARRSAAEANLALTEAALREANAPLMQAALKAVPEDLRDNTWRYLLAQSDTSIAQPGAGNGQLSQLAADPRRPGVFAVLTGGGKILLMDVRHGTKLLEFATPLSPDGAEVVSALAFSPDGERIAVGRKGTSSKGGILIYSARDGKKLQEWDAPHTSRLSFSPNGKMLLQADVDKATASAMRLNAWDASSGRLLWTFEGVSGAQGMFTPDSLQVVAYTYGKASLLSASDGSLVRPLGSSLFRSMAAHPNGSMVVLGGDDGSIRGVGLADAKVLFEFRPQKTRIHQLAFTPDGARFVSVSVLTDGRQAIEVWNAATGAPSQFMLGGSGPVTSAGVHPLTGELLVTGPTTRVWSLAGAKWNLLGIGAARAAFWGNDDQIFAPNPRGNGALQRLHGTTSTPLWYIPNGHGIGVEVSADGRFALTGINNKEVPLSLLKHPGTEVETVSYFTPLEFRRLLRLSPSGDRVVNVVDFKVEVNVYDATTGKLLARLELGDINRVNAIGWSSDGRHLLGVVTAIKPRGNEGSEERVVVWDAASGKILQSAANATSMDVISVSPDGHRFAEGGADKRLRIRDAATLAVQREFRAHDAAITALAWHPTKGLLASASDDLSIRVWDLETGTRLEDLHGFIAPPTELNFSPTGTRLAAAAQDEGTRVWELPTRQKSAPHNLQGQNLPNTQGQPGMALV